MKRKYEKPMAFEEVFAAENYCTTACYKIACKIHEDPHPEYHWTHKEYSSRLDDHLGDQGSGCINPDLNRILVKDGTLISIQEKSEHGGAANGGNGWMAGELDYPKNSHLEPGMTVYWHTTRNNNGFINGWNHYGVIQSADSSHPNHS